MDQWCHGASLHDDSFAETTDGRPASRHTVAVIRPPTIERVLPWLLRLTWIGVLAVGGAAIDSATADRSDAVRNLARSGSGAVWLVGVIAMAVPAVASLTATRSIVPIAVPTAVTCLAAGADSIEGAAFVALSLVAALLASSGELGRAFIQASAYGAEDRFPLRPPAAYLMATGATWAAWAAGVLAGPLLLATHRWIVGGAITALAVGGTFWLWPRWHRLSRRWFVIVPVGLVVHDQLVLAETLMLRKPELASVRLAPRGTGAADLTGPASGHAIEIVTREPVTAILAASPQHRSGRPIHLSACLVAPTRPGEVLRAAARRRLPVGDLGRAAPR